MKITLKKIWKSLPIGYRKTYYLLGERVSYLVCLLTGGQVSSHSIGKVPISFIAKPYLKHSVAQQGEDLILDRIITRILNWDISEPRLYVDVGAYHPVDCSVTYLLYCRGWKGIAFDPSLTTHKSFRFWRKSDRFVQAVVGDQDNVKVEFFTPKTSVSDMCQTATKYPIDKDGCTVKKIDQINLSQELSRQGVNKVDVLNLDVEGGELEILRSLDFNKFSPVIIAVEIHGNDVQKCLLTEEAQLILSKGYRLVGCTVITFFFVKESYIPL
jgi:FkbM family methyltransferase